MRISANCTVCPRNQSIMHVIETQGLKSTLVVFALPQSCPLRGNERGVLQIRDRRYGRTNLAMYGPDWARTEKAS